MARAELTQSSVGIQHVLMATDFSHCSDTALTYGMDFAHLFGAQAEVVYVMPTEEYVIAGTDGIIAAREATRRDLLDLRNRLRRSDPFDHDDEFQLSLLEGPVAESLLQHASAHHADLIVVGTHGRGELGKIVLGSVAENIFRHSPVPVLTIGPNTHRPRRTNEVRQILAPCDLTPKSHAGLRFACALAEAHKSRLTVLHVVNKSEEATGVDASRVKDGVAHNLAEIVGAQVDKVDVDYQVEFGKVAPSILSVASGIDADLIIVGVRPSSGVLDRLMWPIAYELVRDARCPVLTIRGKSPSH